MSCMIQQYIFLLYARIIFLIASEGYGLTQVACAKDSNAIALLVPLFLTRTRSHRRQHGSSKFSQFNIIVIETRPVIFSRSKMYLVR